MVEAPPCARFLSVDLLRPCLFPFSVVVFVIPVARGPYRPEAVGLLGDPFRGGTVGMNPGARVLRIDAQGFSVRARMKGVAGQEGDAE